MKIRIYLPMLTLCLGLLIALTDFPARAGGTEPFEPINAKIFIEQCWALSKDDRDSGVTGRMRDGTMKTVRCMQGFIVDQAAEMFEPDTLSRQDVQGKLDNIRKNYGSLYWSIYNEHKRCGVECGTDRDVYHLAAYTALLEDIIRDMVRERNFMKF